MKNQRGFTLIEIMVVVIILGLLAGLVLPRVLGQEEKARINAAKTQIRALEGALAAWVGAGGTLAEFVGIAIPAYLADEERFLLEKRHHARHLRAKLDAYRVAAAGAPELCPGCGGRLDDGRAVRSTNRGRMHMACADQARSPA